MGKKKLHPTTTAQLVKAKTQQQTFWNEHYYIRISRD